MLTTAVIAAWAAHPLSWAASFWLVPGPVYEGVSITTEGTTRVGATFIETNGLHVIWVPFVHGLPRSHSDIDAPGATAARITTCGPPAGHG